MKGVSSAHAANSISRLLISPAIPPPCQNPRRRRTDFAGAVASLVLSFACLIAVVHSKNPHQSEEHGSEKCVEVSEHTLEFLNERNGRGWSHRACQRAGDSKQDKEAKGVDQTCSNIDTKWDLQLIEQSFSRCAVPAWINDTARFQVGEHASFSITRASCAQQGQFAPPPSRPRVTVLVDYELPLALQMEKDSILVAWLVEPEVVCPSCYQFVRDHVSSFEVIGSHDDKLVSYVNLHDSEEERGRVAEAGKRTPRGVFVNAAVPSVPFAAALLYPKPPTHSLLSVIVSRKLMTAGHRLRQEALSKFPEKLGDVYGIDHKPLGEKVEALQEYRFHIVIENNQKECYFTEKLLDCLVTGTVPLYWGCERIGDIFDTGGMLLFSSLDELEVLLDALSVELYDDMLLSVQRNWEVATRAYTFMSPLHHLWLSSLSSLLSKPSLRILSPKDGQEIPAGEGVWVEYAVKASRTPCAAMLLLNELLVSDLSGCAGRAWVGPERWVRGLNTVEVLLVAQDRKSVV